MCEIKLVKPSVEYGAEIMAFRQELLDEKAGFDGCAGLQKFDRAEDWIEYCRPFESPDTCPEGKAPASTYLGVRESDNKVVGMIDLRHRIEGHPILSVWGGHIGYTVRPSERRRGYAKEMLRLSLEKYREMGLERVLVTCYAWNEPSEKTIRANGGVFEKEIELDGERFKRFWIDLKK